MFHPVGPQPPSVYWRRRLTVFGSLLLLIVLLVLTVRTATSDGTDPNAAGGTSPAITTPAASTSHVHATHAHTSPRTSTSATKSSTAAPKPCDPKDLAIAAVTTKSTYHVGDQPVLELQVTNTGSKPCVQDLADKQVVLRVYNGESRVWGSHDCQIEPGTNDRTLAVDTPVRVAITWSGLTSQPHCAGTRQRVGAGTYTLYAELSGKTGKATQFTIS
jgi:hypothetical protein